MGNNIHDYGIWFNGHHSTEFGLDVLEDKQIGFPSKNKALRSVPLSNRSFDFSKVTGKNTWTERQIKIPFQVVNRQFYTQETLYSLWTKVMKWLMETTEKTRLYDDTMNKYYYMAEVIDAPSFEEMRARGVITVTFQCYPFRIAEKKEGTQLWDDINFDLDYFQTTKFDINRKSFEPLSIGSQATLTAWATHYGGGVRIPVSSLGVSYKITGSKDFVTSYSRRAYMLEGLTEWTLEQDIIQAQQSAEILKIYNPGIAEVVPKITSRELISVIMNGYVFNIGKGIHLSELFMFDPGMNDIKIVSLHPTTVDFEFFKELI